MLRRLDLHEEVLEFGREETALGCAVSENLGNIGSGGSASLLFVRPSGDAAEADLLGEVLEDGRDGTTLGCMESENIGSGGVVAESDVCLQHSVSKIPNSSSICHPHARILHCDSSASGVSSGVSGACGVSSIGSVGASGWGRGSARSAWCFPGCGLYGDGTLCMTCALDTHGGVNSCTNNTSEHLRVVRSHEFGEGTKPLKVSSRIQVGAPIVENVPGNAILADYLRWAPRRWPIEARECRVVNSLD